MQPRISAGTAFERLQLPIQPKRNIQKSEWSTRYSNEQLKQEIKIHREPREETKDGNHHYLAVSLNLGCNSCSCRALPATTIGNTCSRSVTTHSRRTGLFPSYSKNSRIFSGSSSADVHRMLCTPIAWPSLTKSGFCIRVCEYRAS